MVGFGVTLCIFKNPLFLSKLFKNILFKLKQQQQQLFAELLKYLHGSLETWLVSCWSFSELFVLQMKKMARDKQILRSYNVLCWTKFSHSDYYFSVFSPLAWPVLSNWSRKYFSLGPLLREMKIILNFVSPFLGVSTYVLYNECVPWLGWAISGNLSHFLPSFLQRRRPRPEPRS